MKLEAQKCSSCASPLPEAVAGVIECAYCGSKFRVDIFTGERAAIKTNVQQSKAALPRKPINKRKLILILGTLAVLLAVMILGIKVYNTQRYYRIINGAQISPDGKRFISVHGQGYGLGGGTLRIWDAATGKPLKVLQNKGALMWQIVWSPDGKRFATGEQDGITEIWDAETMERVHRLQGSGGFVDNLVWSPDSKRLAVGNDKGMLRVWDAESGTMMYAQPLHAKNIDATAWSPDGTMIATGGWDNMIRVVEAATGRLLMEFKDTSYVDSVAWSADSKLLASGGLSNVVRLFDVTKGKELFTLAGHQNSVREVAWSPDGKLVASVAADNSLRIWDAAAGRVLQALDNDGYNQNLMWSPDGKQLASGGRGMVRVWDRETGTVNSIRGFSTDNDVRIIGWSADGKQLLTIGTYDEVMKMWEVSVSKEMYSCQVSFWEAALHSIF